jgi:transposase-like protein
MMVFPRFLWPVFDHLLRGPGSVACIAALFDHGLSTPRSWLRKYRVLHAASESEFQEVQQRLNDIATQLSKEGLTDDLRDEIKILRSHLTEGLREARELSTLVRRWRLLLRFKNPDEFDQNLRLLADGR